jgi:hypothetical protein
MRSPAALLNCARESERSASSRSQSNVQTIPGRGVAEARAVFVPLGINQIGIGFGHANFAGLRDLALGHNPIVRHRQRGRPL